MINPSKIYKMRIVLRWAKDQPSPGPLMNELRNMVLHAGLPFEPAKINKAWPRLSCGPTAAKGQWAEREYADIYLSQRLSADEVRRRLEFVAVPGVTILEVRRVPYALPSVQHLAVAAQYRIEGDFARFHPRTASLEEFVSSGKVPVQRQAENGNVLYTDAKAYIVSAVTRSPREVALTLQCVGDKWFRPQWLVAAWLGLVIPAQEETFSVEGLVFIRENLFWRDSQGELHAL